MKKILTVLFLCIPVLGAIANGQQGAAPEKDGPEYLDVYLWGSGDDSHSKLIDAFNEQATEVFVTPHYIPAGDYESKLATLLAGGVEMDVFFQKRQTDMFPHFSNGYIEPLNELIEKHEFDFSTLNSWKEALVVGDQIAGLPYRAGKSFTYYNEKPFREKGIPTPQELVAKGEWTWDKFIEISQALSENDGKTYGSCLYTWGNQQVYPAVQKGVQFITRDGKVDLDKSVLYSVQMRKELEDGQDMTPLVELKVTKTHYSQVMYEQTAPMIVIGEWVAGMMHDAFSNGKALWDEADFRITRMPSDTPDYKSVGAPTFTHIASVSKKKDVAFEFISWLASDKGAETLADLGFLPPVTNDTVKEAVSKTVLDPLSLDYYLEDISVIPMYYNKYGSKIEQTIGRFTEKYLLEELTDDNFLDELSKELQTIVDSTY